MIRRTALVTAVAIAIPAVAHADDKSKAAEHFALAQSAERRRDWRAAIDEYEQAYTLSPHPSVLYNIGLNHERLASWRDAARYFLRYLDGSPRAEDRDQVLARVRGLREKPSSVSIDTWPEGAAVHVDGADRGRAPIILALSGGRIYQVVAAHQGRRSPAHPIAPEYGEAVSLSIDMDVTAAAPGGEPAGTAVEQNPEVLPVATAPATGGKKEGGHKLVSAGGYGYHSNGQGARLTFSFGYRTPGNLFEIGFLTGLFGQMQAIGGEARLFLTTTPLRPYLRGGALYGWHEFASSATALEAGGGLLLATQPGGMHAVRGIGVDYFIEVIGHRRRVTEEVDLAGDPPDDQDGSSVAIMLGLGARLGGP